MSRFLSISRSPWPSVVLALLIAVAGYNRTTAQVQALPPTTAEAQSPGWGSGYLGSPSGPAARITGARAIRADATPYYPSTVADPVAPPTDQSVSPASYGPEIGPPGAADPLETAQVPTSAGMIAPPTGSAAGVGSSQPIDASGQSVLQRSLDGDLMLDDPMSPLLGEGQYDPPLVSAPSTCEGPGCWADRCWQWHVLPDGIIYKSYLAGLHEPRLGATWFREQDGEWFWDSTLGARVGLLRYGTRNVAWPEGWQLDAEGAAFPRLTLDEFRDLVSADFRFGFLLTYRQGPWETKFGYYHLSSHIGDEYLERHPGYTRINYVRETLVLGLGWRPHPNWRLYSEVGYSVYNKGGSQPWELQFGAEYSPARPTGFWGTPFLAVNGHLREENDYGGNVTAQAGLQWRGRYGDLLRLGFHYLNGTSNQYQFYRNFEDQVGMGLWYDY